MILAAAASTSACLRPPERTTMAPVEAREVSADEHVEPIRAVAARPDVRWTGRDLDGGDVTLTPDDMPEGIGFVGDQPTAITRIGHLAKARACDALIDHATFWRVVAASNGAGAVAASAFARHAADVAAFVGCAGVGATTGG